MSFFCSWTKKTNQIIGCLVVLLGFSLSISVYVSDVFVLLIVFFWLASGNWAIKWKRFLSSKFSVSIFLFFCFYCLSLLWGDLNNDSVKWIQKQAILLLAPVLISSQLKPVYVKWAIFSLFFGVFINAVVAFGVFFGVWEVDYHHYTNELVAIGFLDHFDHSLFLCFLSLFLMVFIFYKNKSLSFSLNIFLFCLFLFLCVSLFLSHGRSGQYVFLFISVLFLVCYLKSSLRFFLIGLTILGVSLGLLFSTNNPFSLRLKQAQLEYQEFFLLLNSWEENRVGPRSAIGNRLTYLFNYGKIVKENPFFGVGAGESIKEYNNIKDRVFPGIPARPPHNNYLFILLEIGLVGLFFWLLMFFCYFLDVKKNPFLFRDVNLIKLLLPFVFLLMCFTDEYLVRHNPSLFFSFTTALFCLKNFDLNFLFISSKKHPL